MSRPGANVLLLGESARGSSYLLCHLEQLGCVIPDNWNVAHLNPHLRRWEHSYNTVRPHQALGYLTAHEFLERRRSQPK